MTPRARKLTILAATAAVVAGLIAGLVPALGSQIILRPYRKAVQSGPPSGTFEMAYQGEGIRIRGWQAAAEGKRRGTIIYLHGISDNRESGRGVIERYRRKGFDVIACDHRAHGKSGGDYCTYGYFEKRDVARLVERLPPGPVILIGSSLGAAIALQTAAIDPRVSGVVSAEVFSDLRTVAMERGSRFLPRFVVARSLGLAGEKAGFQVDDASPLRAAASVKVPVLMIHGALDHDTLPAHSRRVFDALAGPKELVLRTGTGHNHSLSGDVWDRIDAWVDGIVPPDQPEP